MRFFSVLDTSAICAAAYLADEHAKAATDWVLPRLLAVTQGVIRLEYANRTLSALEGPNAAHRNGVESWVGAQRLSRMERLVAELEGTVPVTDVITRQIANSQLAFEWHLRFLQELRPRMAIPVYDLGGPMIWSQNPLFETEFEKAPAFTEAEHLRHHLPLAFQGRQDPGFLALAHCARYAALCRFRQEAGRPFHFRRFGGTPKWLRNWPSKKEVEERWLLNGPEGRALLPLLPVLHQEARDECEESCG
jgi:hypothetical protein